MAGRQCADMIFTTDLLIEKSRIWPDRPLAMIKLDKRKAFDQLYRSKVALALAAAGARKRMLVVGGRCCQKVLPWNVGYARAGGPLHARALLLPAPACPEMVRPGPLCGYRWQTLGSLSRRGRPFSGSWSCLEIDKDALRPLLN